MNKKELRLHCKEIRKKLNFDKFSKNIVNLIIKSDIFKSSKNILIFYPLKFEINLLKLLDFDKNFFLPKTKNNSLLVCPFKKNDILIEGKFGIFEPISEPVNPKILDLIFFPGLAFDKENNRLGYGGGYYDFFINYYYKNTIKKPVFAGVIHDYLFFNKIPTEKHDNKMDFIFHCK